MQKEKCKRKVSSPRKRISVVRLELVRESSFLSLGQVEKPADANELFRRFLGKESDRELCALLCLDIKNRPTAMQVVSIGTLDSTPIHPREIFKTAILANAASVICAHWHPSGDPQPSSEDVNITRRLMLAGEIIGISLLDHLILGAENAFISLNELGRMEANLPYPAVGQERRSDVWPDVFQDRR